MAPKLEQRQCLVMDGSIPLNDFCWEYANALLQKLISLEQEDRLFEEGNEAAEKIEEANFHSRLSPIALAILPYLVDQFPGCDFPSGTAKPSGVKSVIALAQEVLDIFIEEA